MKDARFPRRQILAGTLAGVGGLTWPSGRAQAGPDLHGLVRLIVDTPRDKLVEVMAEKIRGGAGYRELLAATFLAGAQGIRARPVGFEFHCVLAVQSAHLAAQGGPPSERFLPLLWAMDNFKDAQAVKRRKGEGDWALPKIDDRKLPPAGQARARYQAAMAAWDEEAADLAITALTRSAPPEQIRDLLFRHGARDFRDIGHKAIYAASAWRTLGTIGWQHAEPVLRSLTFACLEHGGSNPAQRDDPADRPGRENLERIRKIRAGWAEGEVRPAAVGELLPVLRRAPPAESCAAVAKQLDSRTAPASIWDALFLYAAELVMRHAEIVSLHAVTSVNALHQAYRLSTDGETRLFMLLQAAAFVALFRDQLDDADQKGGARIDALEPLAVANKGAEARQVFADVGPQTPRASRAALGLLDRDRRQGAALVNEGRRLLFAKGRGAHDYKFSAAVFEDFELVSAPHRHRYLAANLALLAGASETDNPLYARAHSALRS
jgi:hypothetical protein